MAVEIVMLEAGILTGPTVEIPSWPEARPGDLRIVEYQYVVQSPDDEPPDWSPSGWTPRAQVTWGPHAQFMFAGGAWSRVVDTEGDPAASADSADTAFVFGELRIRGARPPADDDWTILANQTGDSRPTNPTGGFDVGTRGRHVFGIVAQLWPVATRITSPSVASITTPEGYAGDSRTESPENISGQIAGIYASSGIVQPGPYDGPVVQTPGLGEGLAWSLMVTEPPAPVGATGWSTLTVRKNARTIL